jgi:hypothetical protein
MALTRHSLGLHKGVMVELKSEASILRCQARRIACLLRLRRAGRGREGVMVGRNRSCEGRICEPVFGGGFASAVTVTQKPRRDFSRPLIIWRARVGRTIRYGAITTAASDPGELAKAHRSYLRRICFALPSRRHADTPTRSLTPRSIPHSRHSSGFFRVRSESLVPT